VLRDNRIRFEIFFVIKLLSASHNTVYSKPKMFVFIPCLIKTKNVRFHPMAEACEFSLSLGLKNILFFLHPLDRILSVRSGLKGVWAVLKPRLSIKLTLNAQKQW
jgi:hypothetical protein